MRARMSSHPRGFTLVEVLIAGSILAVIGLGFAAMLKHNFFAARQLESRGEIEDVRRFLKTRTDCAKTLTGYATPSGFPSACHEGKGQLEVKQTDDSVLIEAPSSTLGGYEVKVSCPGPGPEHCGCETGECPSCGEKLRFEYRHATRPNEREWKNLFGINIYPCSEFFGGPVASVFLHPHEFAPPKVSMAVEGGQYDGSLRGCSSSTCVLGCGKTAALGIPAVHRLDDCRVACTTRNAGAFCSEMGMVFVEMNCAEIEDSYVATHNPISATFRWAADSRYQHVNVAKAIAKLTCAWGNKEPPSNTIE